MKALRFLAGILSIAACVTACGVSHDGELLWKFEAAKAQKQWVSVDKERVYLSADDVYCLAGDTGELLWKFTTFGSHSSAPVIDNGRLFFQCGGLYALDSATGSVLWEFWPGAWATVSPAVGAGRVYAPAGNRMYCLDADTGKSLWSVKTGILRQAPVLIGTRLFFSRGEMIACLDVSSGKVLWRFKVGSGRVRLGAAGDFLLSVGSAGLMRAHLAEKGTVQWKLDTGMQRVRFSMLPEGRVLVAADGLYCLDIKTGTSLWTFKQDKVFVFDAQGLGNSIYARGTKLGFFRIAMHDGSFTGRLRLPYGGRLLKDKKRSIFFPGGKRREFTCLSVSAL